MEDRQISELIQRLEELQISGDIASESNRELLPREIALLKTALKQDPVTARKIAEMLGLITYDFEIAS